MFAWFSFRGGDQEEAGRRRTRLAAEALEERWLPFKFHWSPLPGAANLDYHTAANWAKWNDNQLVWQRASNPPASADDISFSGSLAVAGENGGAPRSTNVNITLSQAGGWDVHSITIYSSYTAVFTLQSDLVVTGEEFTPTVNSNQFSTVTMSSATIAGDGGKLILDPGARFDWSGGTLRDLTVLVSPKDATHPRAEVVVTDTGAGSGPLMLSSMFDVSGALSWVSENVNSGRSGANAGPSSIHVRGTGRFDIDASGKTWGTNSNDLVVTNRGTVTALVGGIATLNGSYTTHGFTRVVGGTLRINGPAEQSEPQAIFGLQGGTIRTRGDGNILGIRDGYLLGYGTVDGNLNLGNQTGGSGVPMLAPGDGAAAGAVPGAWSMSRGIGRIDVTENLHMFSGNIAIDITGPAEGEYDSIHVQGYAIVTGTIIGKLMTPHARIPADTRVYFLWYAQRPSDFTGQNIPPGWTRDASQLKYWLQPPNTAVRGRVGADANGNGILDFGESGLAGVAAELLDDDGEAVVEPTTTNAAGEYDFGAVEYGNYHVRFTRPTDLRPVPPGLGDEYTDSDIDFHTLTVGVTVDETTPFSDPYTDALFRPLLAVDDEYETLYRTPVGGNVLANDPPVFPGYDDLLVTLSPGSYPAGGDVVLNNDGSFVYTPRLGFWGTDSFVYAVEDPFGHVATATVTIEVIPTPVTITGTVWEDTDGDGLQDAGEPGFAGFVVAVYDQNNVIVAQLLTGVDGSFAFTLGHGTYRLRVTAPNANPSPQDVGNDDTIDSDTDGSGWSPWFTLIPEETIDLDAGFQVAFVWVDR